MSFQHLLRWTAATLFVFAGTACQKPAATSAALPPPASNAPVVTSAAPAPATPGAAKLTSAEPTSFEAVARQLDSGGGLYFYLSTEPFMDAASKKLAELAPLLFSAAKINGPQKAQAEAAWNSAAGLMKDTGIGEITGFGASSIALEPGYYQTKWMVHHYQGKGTGFIWKLSGDASMALDITSYLPVNTAAAGSWDFTLVPLWDAILKAAGANVELSQGLQAVTQQFEQASGLKLPALLSGLGPNYSLVLTLDEKRITTLPMGATGKTFTMPEPALGLLLHVRDEALINRVETELGKLPGVIKADDGEVKVRVIPVPAQVPFLHPAVAWSKGLLMVVSNEALIHEMLAVKAGKTPGIAAAPEFKKLTVGLPTSASQFQFAAPVFQKTVANIQMLAAQQPTVDPAAKQLMEYFMKNADQHWGCSVVRNTPEGWLGTVRGGGGPAQIAAAGAVVPVALLSAIAVPNFMRARARSEATRVLEDARMIDAAVDQWAIEKNKKAGDQPTTDDIKAYLKTGTALWNRANSNPGRTTIASSVDGVPELLIPPVDKTEIIPKSVAEKFHDGCPDEFWKPFLKK